MMARIVHVVVLCGLVAFTADIASAEDRVDELLAQKLAEIQGAERGRVISITDPSVAAALPNHRFAVLRFPQYPVAVAPPALRANNLFVVKPDSSVEYVPDAQALESVFRSALAPVTNPGEAKAAVEAWLRLVEEFHQDGFFAFSIPDDALKVSSAPSGGIQVTGRAVVTGETGNAGEISAVLVFDEAGRLVRASEVAGLKRGIRPICQASKLLDPDPIVRGMAEQDLLVMGKTAKEYLEEQRAQAGPELRAAIDRVWRRILREDR